jgi:23S rRNA G2069 N7-methylase RlmK/C1962 C5-methylase RlmI
LPKNNSSTTPTAGKQALKKPSSAISKQQEKEIAVNKTSKRPTRKRSKRNTKKNRRYMTNPKQSESNTEKNPWAMANPNYKFGKNILSDGDLNTFYMQRGELDDVSDIMIALRPGTNAWLEI